MTGERERERKEAKNKKTKSDTGGRFVQEERGRKNKT